MTNNVVITYPCPTCGAGQAILPPKIDAKGIVHGLNNGPVLPRTEAGNATKGSRPPDPQALLDASKSPVMPGRSRIPIASADIVSNWSVLLDAKSSNILWVTSRTNDRLDLVSCLCSESKIENEIAADINQLGSHLRCHRHSADPEALIARQRQHRDFAVDPYPEIVKRLRHRSPKGAGGRQIDHSCNSCCRESLENMLQLTEGIDEADTDEGRL